MPGVSGVFVARQLAILHSMHNIPQYAKIYYIIVKYTLLNYDMFWSCQQLENVENHAVRIPQCKFGVLGPLDGPVAQEG